MQIGQQAGAERFGQLFWPSGVKFAKPPCEELRMQAVMWPEALSSALLHICCIMPYKLMHWHIVDQLSGISTPPYIPYPITHMPSYPSAPRHVLFAAVSTAKAFRVEKSTNRMPQTKANASRRMWISGYLDIWIGGRMDGWKDRWQNA